MYKNKHGLEFKNPISTYKPAVIEVRTHMPDGDGDVVRFEMPPEEFPAGMATVTSYALNNPEEVRTTQHAWPFVSVMLGILGEALVDGIVGDRKEKPTSDSQAT